jgi:4-hydroxybenzoate polyprenyltransferase
MIDILKLLRIHQWLKNFLIFFPFIISNKQLTLDVSHKLFLGFFCFSLIASSVYIFNDLLDLKYDRKHITKKNRPIASGTISPRVGFFTALSLISISLYLWTNLIVTGSYKESNFLIFLIIYFLLGLFYSLIIKKIIILDIITLAIFYLFRLLIGGDIVSINVSYWLIFFSLFFFFSLGTLKRFAEILNKKNKKKILGRPYYISDNIFLKILGISTSLISVLILALYINTEIIYELYKAPHWLIVNIFLYFVWVIYIWIKASRNEMNEDIIKFIFKDIFSILILLFFLIFLFLSKY